MFSLYIIHNNFFVKKLVMNCLLWKTPQRQNRSNCIHFQIQKILNWWAMMLSLKGDRVEANLPINFSRIITLRTLYAL